MTLQEKLEQATKYLQQALKINAPKDTGNLSLNAIRISQVSPNEFRIIIGGEIAPYAVFTNEKWINRKGVNPNQNWVERTLEQAKPFIAQIMSGAITLTEIEEALVGQRVELQAELDELAGEV